VCKVADAENVYFYATFYYENGNFLLFKVSLSERRSAPYVQHVDNDAKRREILCFMGHFCSKNKLTPRRYLHCTTANIDNLSFVLFNDISISLDYESQKKYLYPGEHRRARATTQLLPGQANAKSVALPKTSRNLER